MTALFFSEVKLFSSCDRYWFPSIVAVSSLDQVGRFPCVVRESMMRGRFGRWSLRESPKVGRFAPFRFANDVTQAGTWDSDILKAFDGGE